MYVPTLLSPPLDTRAEVLLANGDIEQQQVMKSFVKAAYSGVLQSGALSSLTPIPLEVWQDVWSAANAALGQYPAIGSSMGASPNTPNDRIMESFGSKLYREPFFYFQITHQRTTQGMGGDACPKPQVNITQAQMEFFAPCLNPC